MAAYVAIYFITGVVFLSVVVLAVPCIFIAARRGWGMGAAFFAACVGATYPLGGVSALLAGMAVFPCVIVTSYVIRSRKRAWDSLVLSCGAALVSAGLILLYYYLVSGKDILEYAVQAIVTKIRQDDTFATAVYWTATSSAFTSDTIVQTVSSITLESMREYLLADAQLLQLKETVSVYLPQIVMSYVLYGGICAYFISRLLAKGTGLEVARVPKFSMFSLPRQHGIYLLVLTGLAFIPTLFSIEALLMPAQVFLSMATLIFAIEGLSFISFLLGIKIKSRAFCVILALGLYAFLPTLVVFSGMFEQIVRIRDKPYVFQK